MYIEKGLMLQSEDNKWWYDEYLSSLSESELNQILEYYKFMATDIMELYVSSLSYKENKQ